eukprot:5489941-Amphidinium_carterae.1
MAAAPSFRSGEAVRAFLKGCMRAPPKAPNLPRNLHAVRCCPEVSCPAKQPDKPGNGLVFSTVCLCRVSKLFSTCPLSLTNQPAGQPLWCSTTLCATEYAPKSPWSCTAYVLNCPSLRGLVQRMPLVLSPGLG